MRVAAATSLASVLLLGKNLLMKVITGTLVNANSIDAVNNLWELKLLIDGSLNVRKYIVRSRHPFRNGEIRRFRLILKRNTVLKI